jgi:hypothetical protein
MTNGISASGRTLVAGTALVFAAAGLLAGCGNLTAGGVGEIGVSVSGDSQSPTPAMTAAGAGASLAARPSLTIAAPWAAEEEQLEGQLEIEFLLFLVSAEGSSLQLGEELEARVDLSGRSEADVVEESVPAGRYEELQIVFTSIEAQVDKGLVIDGVEVTGPIRVDLEDLTLSVARPIDITVEDGSRVALVIDLNSAAWLQGVDPANGTVDESFFASLVDVVVR